MTAPHPMPPLVALAALAALFFMLLAIWLPSPISELEVGSGGGTAAAPAPPSAQPAMKGPTTENVFRQPAASPLWLFAGR